MSSLDDRIAELYGLPLEQFVASRTALAKTLSGAEARRVKALVKPTVVPWAVNQVYWHARMVYNTLLAQGAVLRKAQIAALEGKKSDASAAQQAHRKAVATAVARASELARAAGASPGNDELSRMFEAVSLTETPSEPHGQFTRAIAPAGFEALAGVTVKVVPRPATDSETSAPGRGNAATAPAEAGKKKSAAQLARERLEAQKAAAADRLREAAVAKAERRLERAQAVEAEARAAWQKAKQEVDEAERGLRALE